MTTDTGETYTSGDEDGAAHGEPGWIGPFVAWAREEVDEPEFEGASVPRRVRALLRDGGVRTHGAAGHDAEDPERPTPDPDEG